MREIDNRGEILAFVDLLHPTGDRFHIRQTGLHGRQIRAIAAGGGNRCQTVIDVECPGQRREVGIPGGVEEGPARFIADTRRLEVCFIFDAVHDHLIGGFGGEIGRTRIIGVDNRDFRDKGFGGCFLKCLRHADTGFLLRA